MLCFRNLLRGFYPEKRFSVAGNGKGEEGGVWGGVDKVGRQVGIQCCEGQGEGGRW